MSFRSPGWMLKPLIHWVELRLTHVTDTNPSTAHIELTKILLIILTDTCDPGWSYFNGFCYFTSDKCVNWTTALTKCREKNSVLVDVNNNEENVYLQHRHNGEKSWLGFNDISTEGTFIWADRGAGNFTAWAKNQPNNFGEEDCAHALGVNHNYEWNDVPCSNCHPYTCKKGTISKWHRIERIHEELHPFKRK